MPAVSVYDPQTNATSTVSPITETLYDAAGNPQRVRDANGNWRQTEYDARNRPTRSILDLDGDGLFETPQGPSAEDVVTVSGYDFVGNIVYAIDANGNRVDTTYDRADRPTLVQAPAVADALASGALTRPQTLTAYDKNGNVTTMTDPLGLVTQTEYDEWDRARKVTANANAASGSADKLVTESRYDANSNVAAVVLHNWVGGVQRPQVTTYTYDAFDRQTSETLPSVSGGPRVDRLQPGGRRLNGHGCEGADGREHIRPGRAGDADAAEAG